MCGVFLFLRHRTVCYAFTVFQSASACVEVHIPWFYFTKFLLTDSMKFDSSFNIQFQYNRLKYPLENGNLKGIVCNYRIFNLAGTWNSAQIYND